MPLLTLHLPLSGDRPVWLRELCGADEQLDLGTDTQAALQLLDRLLLARPGTFAGPGEAARLTTADRDQVLAALCSDTFGDRVQGTRQCASCGHRFDLDFRLSHLARAVLPSTLPPENGVYTLPGGVRFRLPTGEDEQAILGLPVERGETVLLERCLISGDSARDGASVLASMAEVGPTLDLDLDAACAECGQVEAVPFSVQSWLLGHLERERKQLPRQVHLLARAYGWGLQEILSLPRPQRKLLVGLIEEERRSLQGVRP